MLTIPSFLALMVAPSASEKISWADLQRGFVGIARFAQFDEVGVLGKTAGIDEEGDPKFAV